MPPVGAYDTGVNGHLINDCAQIYPLLEIALTVIGSLGGRRLKPIRRNGCIIEARKTQRNEIEGAKRRWLNQPKKS